MTTSNTNDLPNAVPKAYWIKFATVNEPSRFGNYTSVACSLNVCHVGRMLARGDVAVVVEGAVTGRPCLNEFPSYEVAQDCFNS